jgi:hypothetical protein
MVSVASFWTILTVKALLDENPKPVEIKDQLEEICAAAPV